MNIFTNKIISIFGITAVVAVLAGSCAKETTESKNGDNKLILTRG